MQCEFLLKILVLIAAVIIILFQFIPESYESRKIQHLPSLDILHAAGGELMEPEGPEWMSPEEQTDGLIGMIYPPRLGSLASNRQFPAKMGGAKGGFVAVYEEEPFLRYYNQGTPLCSA